MAEGWHEPGAEDTLHADTEKHTELVLHASLEQPVRDEGWDRRWQ